MAEKILIIDDDLDTLRLVGLMLQKQGYQIAAANNGEQGLVKVAEEKPNLILLDVMMPNMDGYEVARRLRQNPETASIPILMFTAKSQLDDKVVGFEAGADDYLTKPTHPTELHAHVKTLLTRSVKSQQLKQTDSLKKNAFITGVISARGGLGVSSIALNLASALQNEKNANTIMVELTPGRGTVGRNLGFDNTSGLTQLLKSTIEEITTEAVASQLLHHKSGLELLVASEQPKDAPLDGAIPQSETLFAQLASLGRYLIVDFGSSLPLLNQNLLPKCDHVVVLVEAFANSIAHAKLLVSDLLDLGLEREQISIVLNNRMRSDMLLPLNQVEKLVGSPIDVTFTPVPELHSQAIRMKTTAVLMQPESLTNQQFKNLVQHVTKAEVKEK
ncbi:MAG: response regulator [Anaerolineae bacterium]|jgi:CheY-like chemotaxis protein|nr:response regulator [Anaerolineae bacterium]MBT7073180.1 response regulator [Anaerolineae bacterium]MBT7324085.1 response regulator [Anaerolineae bacterium]